MPVAPATFSCAISVILWYFLLAHWVLYITIAAGLFVLGIFVSDSLAKEWGKDPHRIVIDEYASVLLPLFFTPAKILPLAITLLLFRFFDIVKPPPVRNMENLKGGWGIMFDDLMAAVYTTSIILVFRAIGFVF
jgi:phosphatidylglycerophosphatase A